jgi:hypothetical protein
MTGVARAERFIPVPATRGLKNVIITHLRLPASRFFTKVKNMLHAKKAMKAKEAKKAMRKRDAADKRRMSKALALSDRGVRTEVAILWREMLEHEEMDDRLQKEMRELREMNEVLQKEVR